MEANAVPFSIEEVAVSEVNSIINRVFTNEAINTFKRCSCRLMFGSKIALAVFVCGKLSEFL